MPDLKKATAPILLTVALGACGGGAGGNLATFTDSASYAIGMNMAASVARSGAEVHLPAVIAGLSDALEERTTAMTEAEAMVFLQRLTAQLQQAHAADLQASGEANRAEGEAFHAENAAKPGVTTTASGLQYEVVTQGNGPRPAATDRVSVHYRGTLIDGTEFDSSHRRGQPASFAVNGVIAGWTEALQLMPVGSTYRLYVPGDLAYGASGSPPNIGPNATLIFEVELLAIE